MTPDKKRELLDIIDEMVNRKIDTNRRFVDEVLERIQDQNHQYFLARLGDALHQAELQQKAGDVRGAMHHQVMADVYKSILEKYFC